MGFITSIQRFSVDDGPGIRTTVFFKGCNLCCKWCHNPETIDAEPQIRTLLNLCCACGKCVDVCPKGARRLENGELKFERKLCILCRSCGENCPNSAIAICGIEMSADEMLEHIKKDIPFYKRSGGGVNFSGGEPMLQIDFLEQILAKCQDIGIQTAVDTAGNVPFEHFRRIEQYMPLFLFDLKAIDEELHKTVTLSSNTYILENLKLLSAHGDNIIIRIPIIPSINDMLESVDKTAEFISKLANRERVELLAYHRYGENKYKSIGMKYELTEVQAPTKPQMEALITLFKDRGITVS